MAAGLSLPHKNLSTFMQAFDQQVRTLLDEKQLQAVLQTDGELNATDFLLSTATLLRNSEPWGQHFPAPLFEGTFQVLYKRLVGEQHLRLVLKPSTDGSITPSVDAIIFFIDNVLKEKISEGDLLRTVYRLDVNEYQGDENLQLTIEYLERLA